MNVYDSQKMADVLAPLGYQMTENPDEADMMVLNTCHIREKATDKVFSELGRLKVHKKKKEAEGRKMIMAVAGCVAQAEGDFIAERAPYVDMVFGPQTYHLLPEMVSKALDAYGEERVINTDFPADEKFDGLPQDSQVRGPSAFLSIQEGCDKFCTFCVVPYTRGAEYSRSATSILEEARKLVGNGAIEISLLGQNVNAYHGEGPDGKIWSLARLIEEMATIDGLKRIRYTTSHPRDMDEDLIRAHGDIEALMPYLHLPVQSGSNSVLKAMNRKHDRDLYFRIIDDLRSARKDMSFSSDFIVGFPGESDQDFEDTMDMVRRVNYAQAYSFKYSARPGTPASKMPKLIREEIKTERLARLQDLLNVQQHEFNKNSVGLTLPVLVMGKGHKDGQISGKTAYNQTVNFQGNERMIGHIVDVTIDTARPNSLTGLLDTDKEMVLKAS